MKRVIEGKLYNTETADKICDLPCQYYPGDFNYHETTMYRSPKGQYFLAGRGGPKTRWSQAIGNSGYSRGSGIELISKDEARGIAESAEMTPDEMIDAGFEVEEG